MVIIIVIVGKDSSKFIKSICNNKCGIIYCFLFYISTIQRTGTEYLYITVIPFSIVVFRLLFKTYTCSDNDDPAEFIYKDKMLKVLMLLYLIILLIVLFI